MDSDSTQEVERCLELDTGTGHVSDDDKAQGPSQRRNCCGDAASCEEVECLHRWLGVACVDSWVDEEAMHHKKM